MVWEPKNYIPAFSKYAVLLASSVCDLALRMFTAKGEVAGMIAGNSKSEAMVLWQKMVDCFLWVEKEQLPQTKDFKYLCVFVSCDKKIDYDIDKQLGATSAIIWAEGKIQKAKLSTFQSIS